MKVADLPPAVLPRDDRPASAPVAPVRPDLVSDSRLSLWDLVSAIKRDWDDGKPADAQAVLDEHPQLIEDPAIGPDLAYHEYWVRREAGERIDPKEFAARFPQWHSTLFRMITMLAIGEKDLGVLAEDDVPKSWPNPSDSYLGFTLVRELGRGGFARVFLAEEWALGNRKVAIKISKGGAVEAHVLGRLEHPNIVPVNSVRTDPATALTVVCMPYLGEATLVGLLAKAFPKAGGRPPAHARFILDAVRTEERSESLPDPVFEHGTYTEGVVQLGLGLARGLVFVHARGIVHSDLKPANVLLGPDAVPRILDFNLAIDDDCPGAPRVAGTSTFMAPEQLANALPGRGALDEVTASADLFSLGVILYQLLAGEHPYGPLPTGLTFPEMCLHLLTRQKHPPRPLRSFNPGVDEGLRQLIEQCLAFGPKMRPKSAEEVVAALEQIGARLRRERQRRSRLPGLVVGTLLGLLVLGGVGFAGVHVARDMSRLTAVQLIEHARTAYADNNFRGAVEFLNQAFDQEPPSPEQVLFRAQAYQKLGSRLQEIENNVADAELVFTKAFDDYEAVSRPHKDRRAWAGQGFCACQLKLYSQGVSHFNEAIAASPARAPAAIYVDLGICYLNVKQDLNAKRLEIARKQFEQALQSDPNCQAAYHGLALIELQRARSQGSYVPRQGLVYVDNALAMGTLGAAFHSDAASLCAVVAEREAQRGERVSRALTQGALVEGELLGTGSLAWVTLAQGLAEEDADRKWANLRQQALDHVGEALKLGFSPDGMERESGFLLRSLKNDEQFRRLISEAREKMKVDSGQTPRPPVSPYPFLDPIVEGSN